MSMSSLQSLLLFNSLYFNTVRSNSKFQKDINTKPNEMSSLKKIEAAQLNENVKKKSFILPEKINFNKMLENSRKKLISYTKTKCPIFITQNSFTTTKRI